MTSRTTIAVLLIFLANSATVLANSVGRTKGTYALSPTGAATYSIPIWAPPGPHGLKPHIALTYNSQSGNGPLGVGWSLSGFSSIYRCPSTYAQDATPAPITLTYSDRFCMDGKRLRLTSSENLSTYGESGTTYQTELADFSNVTAEGSTGNGPTYFTVQMRNGLTYEYGNGGNSQVQQSGTASAWYLDKITDRSGNTITITYLAPSSNLIGSTAPSTISWASGNSMTFNYSTLSVPHKAGYVGGGAYSNSESLNNITVSIGGTTVKKYVLTYTLSPTTYRETLTSIQECGGSAGTDCFAAGSVVGTNIGYQSGTAGVGNPTNSSGSGSTNGTVYSVDIDGDGKQDLIFATSNGSNYQWWVQFSNGTGYGTPKNTGALTSDPTTFLVDNFLATAGAQLLAPVGGTWYVYRWNGSSFTASSTGVAVVPGAAYASADVDGDGRPDLVSVSLGSSNGVIDFGYQLNTSSAGTVSFIPTPVIQSVQVLNDEQIVHGGRGKVSPSTTSLSSLSVYGNNKFSRSTVRRMDFDGDGRQDLIVSYYASGLDEGYYALVLSRGTNAPVFATSFASGQIIQPGSIMPANLNDDACTDFIYYTTLLISACNGNTGSTVNLPYGPAFALDWDGDGRTDLISFVGADWEVYRSVGTGYAAGESTGIPATGNSFIVTDLNGDGLDDLAITSSTGDITYGLHNGAGMPPDLATSITDDFGNFVQPSYVSLAQSNYQQSNPANYPDATLPNEDYIGPMYVVNEAVFNNAAKSSGTYNLTYEYYGAWKNLQGRGFQGFYEISSTDSRNGLIDERMYDRTFPNDLMKIGHTVSNGTINLSQTTAIPNYTTLDGSSYNQRIFPYIQQWNTSQWEVGGTENGDLITQSQTAFTYDNYGNATNIVKTITDTDPGSPYNGATWTTNTTNTTDISANQSADLAAWCLNMLDETQVDYSSSLSGSGSVTRTKVFTPDTPTACRIKQIVTEPTANSGLYKATEVLTFDSFGNVATDTLTGANMPSSPASREVQMNWGTTGQFLQTVTDPSGAKTTYTYSTDQALGFGVPDNMVDANNLKTSWLYDDFGRKTKETRPDGTSTTWTWSLCSSYCNVSNSEYETTQTWYQVNGTSVIRTDTTLYDPVDRVTQTQGPNVSNVLVGRQTLYDSLGRVTAKSMPFLSGATTYWQSFGYDVLSRLTSTSRPISSTNSTLQTSHYFYAGRTTQIQNPYGHSYYVVNDVNGWLRQATDALGYTVTRAYDSAGSLTGVTDSVGNTLLSGMAYKYGLKPFLIASTDADLGAWTYTVDSLGEKTGWTDAKGQSFSMSYDVLSRPLTRTDPDLYTQWTYGSTPASYNVGQLIAECTGSSGVCSTSAGYAEALTYDSDGRLSTRSITEGGNPGSDPGGAFLYTLTYDPTTGHPYSLTYPKSTSGFALNLHYNFAQGILRTVTDTTDTTGTCGSTCVLWTANAQNGFGQISEETLGNGVVTNRSYDAVTSWLTAATAGVGGGSAILNQSYLQDENGNVTQRQDNNTGLTESFAYDLDYRLTCAALSSSCSGSTFVYDGGSAGPGNITTQAGVGTYSYPAPGQPRPHAVASITGTFNGITNPTFSYDANGNMTARASTSSNITWFSYNYPAAISATDATGSEEVQFEYGPDRRRWEQIYSGPSGTEKTYYVGKDLEVVFNGSTTNYRHYIYAGTEPIAVYSRTSGGVNTMSYFLEDHQGGVSSITSNAGSVAIDESFSAFGTRRNPATWSGTPSATDLNTIAGLSRQGYTFQTALGQSMGLNHMNGRVEDAILGRFLSPDPQIPDPTDAQSYNRFSYVRNNPLSRIDPTGFEDDYIDTGDGGGGGGPSGDSGSGTGGDGRFDPGPLPAPPIDPGETPQLPPIAPAPTTPPTYTGSLIPGHDPGVLTSFGNLYGDSGGQTSSTTATAPASGSNTDDSGSGTAPAAQSQTSQSQASGGSTTFVDPNDATAGIIATGNAQSPPLSAQVVDPVPIFGFDGLDPVMEALQQGRIPTAADYAARAAQFKPQVGVPPPLPQVAPPPPWWLQALQWIAGAIDNIGGASPAAPPVAPTIPPPVVCPPQAPCGA